MTDIADRHGSFVDALNELDKRVAEMENFFKWIKDEGYTFVVTPTPKPIKWKFWKK